jgi:uncharacterized protein (DUF1778 family)
VQRRGQPIRPPHQLANQHRGEGSDRAGRSAYMGTTVSAFMVQNAYEAAKKVVAEHELMMLTKRDFDAFAKALAKPSAPPAALKRLMRR